MEKKYIYNLETGKIELHFDKADYDNLSDESKKELKSNFLWSRRANAWVSRAKVPNLYYAKMVAEKLGFTGEERVGERLSFADQMERKTERAEKRAERYEQYADNAEKRGAELQRDFNERRGDIAFFTQPIIAGHSGSESFGKRRQRIFERYDKGSEEYRKSDYFREKAATAMRTAENACLKDTSYLYNRIKECKASIKKIRNNIERYELIKAALESPKDYPNVYIGSYTLEKVDSYLDDALELFEATADKQGYYENCLEEIGGFKYSKDNIKSGYIVKIKRYGLFKVLKANPTTIVAKSLNRSSIIKFNYADITEIVSKEEETPKEEQETHPYKEGDILVYDPHGSKRYIYAYQVISVTSKTVQLRALKFDDERRPIKDCFTDGSKAIRRKPYVSTYSQQWMVCGQHEDALRRYVS